MQKYGIAETNMFEFKKPNLLIPSDVLQLHVYLLHNNSKLSAGPLVVTPSLNSSKLHMIIIDRKKEKASSSQQIHFFKIRITKYILFTKLRAENQNKQRMPA